ncbi:MAG: hypothetical protein RIR11_3012, partial [Bacteroidota bacterium]
MTQINFQQYLERLFHLGELSAIFDELDNYIKNEASSIAKIDNFSDMNEALSLIKFRWNSLKTKYDSGEISNSEFRAEQTKIGVSTKDWLINFVENQYFNQNYPDFGKHLPQQVHDKIFATEKHTQQPVDTKNKSKLVTKIGFSILPVLIVGLSYLGYKHLIGKPISTTVAMPATPKAKVKQPLTLILHEVGDQSQRSIYNQGRIILSDTAAHRMPGNIKNNGIVRFDSLPDWVFDAQPYVFLDLMNLNEMDFTYRLIDSIGIFSPNDTVYLQYLRTKKVANDIANNPKITNPPHSNNKINLIFHSNKDGVDKHFQFDKNKTVAALKAEIIAKFVGKATLQNSTETYLLLEEAALNPLKNENLSLAAANIREDSKLHLRVVINIAAKVQQPTFTVSFKGQINSSARIKINNQLLDAKQLSGDLVSVSVPKNRLSNKYSVSIQQGVKFYSHSFISDGSRSTLIELGSMK